ncbi:EAL domain-containing protein [Acetobacterium fimetarium]|uniref:EAL domain-containing protein n=1 Tax=Acetobacterium fimetarium TaxID=52691 RepID=A0ABR6WRS8_9FIRM|nr:EAL domain-containing protein [Acetobacterium fimetarium]MBC3803302.1 EAL domain-containing protein [Acetobacterium fimetarium]
MELLQRETLSPEDEIDIAEIIRQKRLMAYFQPIVSVTGRKTIGLEGLIRGIKPGTAEIIPPQLLFEKADDAGLTTELDRACRDTVLQAFKPLLESDPELLLFLNLDTAIIDGVGGSNYLNNQVNRSGIRARNIVIEINESKALDALALLRFVATYKKYGYLIALDDVGAGFSNMDRVAELKPDIIKIDRSIIERMDRVYHKQEVFKSLVNLSNKIGALIIAEGVETECEAIQGFYFSRPMKEVVFSDELIQKTGTVVAEYKKRLLGELEDYNQKCRNYTHTVDQMIAAIATNEAPGFSGPLCHYVNDSQLIDCAYVLDEAGIQCSDTVGVKKTATSEKLVFHSAKIGVDHSIKNFYYNLIRRKQTSFITDPYVSMATGSLCITYSKVFRRADKKYILCVDFLENRPPASAG